MEDMVISERLKIFHVRSSPQNPYLEIIVCFIDVTTEKNNLEPTGDLASALQMHINILIVVDELKMTNKTNSAGPHKVPYSFIHKFGP